MKASIRVNSLTTSGTGDKSLGGMERHGKRQDRTSQMRRTNDAEPLVWGSLDLSEAFRAHVDGCRTNKGLKRPVLHALVQFPKQIDATPEQQKWFLDAAVEFINSTHGGDAVFAARMDRDETGRNVVDVFYAPKYEKITKSRGAEMWISPTKHGKSLCEKHREEIVTRHDGSFLTGPRQVGIALQAELYDWLRARKFPLEDRKRKRHGWRDRLSPEAWKAKQEAKKSIALQRQSDAMRKALVKLHEGLDQVRDLVPTKVMALVDAVHRQENGSARPARTAGQDRPAAAGPAKKPQSSEPRPLATPKP